MIRQPFPRLGESQDSWLLRCRLAELGRDDINRGLRGKPCRPERTEYPAKGDDCIRNPDGTPQTVTLPDGKTVMVVARGERARPCRAVMRYAQRHGLGYHRYLGNSATGMCASSDCISYRTARATGSQTT